MERVQCHYSRSPLHQIADRRREGGRKGKKKKERRKRKKKFAPGMTLFSRSSLRGVSSLRQSTSLIAIAQGKVGGGIKRKKKEGGEVGCFVCRPEYLFHCDSTPHFIPCVRQETRRQQEGGKRKRKGGGGEGHVRQRWLQVVLFNQRLSSSSHLPDPPMEREGKRKREGGGEGEDSPGAAEVLSKAGAKRRIE